jgi:hypothetical protein
VLAAGGLLVALCVTREAGILFGVGFGLALLAGMTRSRLSWRAATAALLATVALLLVVTAAIRPERIAAAGPVFAGNLVGYADAGLAVSGPFTARVHLRMTEIGQLLLPGMFRAYGHRWLDVNTLVYAPVLVLVVIGWRRLLQRGGEVLAFTAPLYIALHLAWPYTAGTRYLLPLLPLLVACLWCAAAPLRSWRRIVVATLLVAHFGVVAGYGLAIDRPRAEACDRDWPAVEWFAARIAAGGAAAVAPPVPQCVQLMLALALDRPVDAAVVGDTQWLVAAAGQPPPAEFSPDTAAGGYVLLRRRMTP